jgi:hypothetical protein
MKFSHKRNQEVVFTTAENFHNYISTFTGFNFELYDWSGNGTGVTLTARAKPCSFGIVANLACSDPSRGIVASIADIGYADHVKAHEVESIAFYVACWVSAREGSSYRPPKFPTPDHEVLLEAGELIKKHGIAQIKTLGIREMIFKEHGGRMFALSADGTILIFLPSTERFSIGGSNAECLAASIMGVLDGSTPESDD